MSQVCGSGEHCVSGEEDLPAVAEVTFPAGQFNTARPCGACLDFLLDEYVRAGSPERVDVNIRPLG